MKSYLITFIFTLGILSLYSQNAYQSQLYLLTDKLNSIESEGSLSRKVEKSFLQKKFEIIKDFHRLGEEVQIEALKKGITGDELTDIISLISDLAVNRLNLLESFLRFKNDLYKTNYDRMKTVYLSLFLKVKALE